ncbi:MAG: OmpH family outer membrane protein [Prevotellaceae bacterium]|jgi:outer membrane protein|nr:OmpH family outer membrane protein [Prevotellaceae bacterium]
MIKKIFIALMCCALPVLAIAQDSNLKIGHVNSADIMQVMPERTTIEKTLSDLQGQWESELLKMREEYATKIKDYQEKEATMPAALKEARQSEIADMEQRMNTLVQTASSELQKKQQELLAPVVDKIKKAIEEVGTANGYTYIIDESTQVLVYISPKANDVTPLVKTKLGIK